MTSASLRLYPASAIEAIHPSTRLSGVIYLALALLAGSMAAAYTGVDLSVVQIAGYGIALGTLVQAARALDCVMPAGRAQEDMPITHLDALLLTLATVSALIPRVIVVDSLPPVTWPDKLDYLSNALSILQGKLVSPFASGTWDAIIYECATGTC